MDGSKDAASAAPTEGDPAIPTTPPARMPIQDVRRRSDELKNRVESGLARTGKFFGGLRNDLKRKSPWYLSDFKDAAAIQCVASFMFLYIASLAPIITFGGILGHITGNNMALVESLVSAFICGIGYGLFSGQPLTLLGPSGSILLFEAITYQFCMTIQFNYMAFRLCIWTWIAVMLVIVVAIDAAAFVSCITRFAEENYASFMAFVFIFMAIANVVNIGRQLPTNTSNRVLPENCSCVVEMYDSTETSIATRTNLTHHECMHYNGTPSGAGCQQPQYVTDAFLMSIILFLGTFVISILLKYFKNALSFPSKVRAVFSDFSVIIAILSMSLLDFFVGISTPKLEVPAEFKPTLEGRGWLISPFNGNPAWSAVVAILPALLGTILIFMDQQITAVIVNRKENKLNKGCGYHLDLFILAILIQICSLMGLPIFVATTVLSINHINSLKLESECAASGEKPQFLGVREQRVTHILIFVMIGCSVLLTPMLRNIPMPVLFGVFLYMGVASLKGLQFFDRLLIMLMPVKYQPDYMFLRQVPIKRMHLFTLVQLACLVCLGLIKSFNSTSILFPLMLVVMIGIRKLLDFVFTRRELNILDDVIPEMTRRNEAEDLH